jgi:hypothetical protein
VRRAQRDIGGRLREIIRSAVRALLASPPAGRLTWQGIPPGRHRHLHGSLPQRRRATAERTALNFIPHLSILRDRACQSTAGHTIWSVQPTTLRQRKRMP